MRHRLPAPVLSELRSEGGGSMSDYRVLSELRSEGGGSMSDYREFIVECIPSNNGLWWPDPAYVDPSRSSTTEIVRCRDCKQFAVDNSDHDYRSGWWCRRWDTDRVAPDGFCAWGESEEAAAEAWNTRAERTCRKLPSSGEKECTVTHVSTGLSMNFGYWKCSECGCECFEGARYCMGCGARVVEE